MARRHKERWYGCSLDGGVLGNAGCWRGIRGVHFLYWGQSDPELRYRDRIINCADVEDFFWEEFIMECGDNGEDTGEFCTCDDAVSKRFGEYLREHAREVKDFIMEYGNTGENYGERTLSRHGYDPVNF